MIEQLVRWSIFSVIIVLLPLLFHLLSDFGKGRGLSLVRVLSHGELLLISAAICAGALGELLGTERTFYILKILSGGACVVILMLASLWYADISSMRTQSPNYSGLKAEAITIGSILIFLFAVIASFCCVLLGRV